MEEDSTTSGSSQSSRLERALTQFGRRYQTLLDRTVIQGPARWAGFVLLLALYWVRVWFAQSHYIVTYGLHIYLLNLLIGFLSPAVDPELEGPTLPQKRGDEEFRPFSRRLPEFKFWYACTRGTVVALCMTFFSLFDVPVFWPILLVYFIALFVLTMRKQIAHMIKHRYIPFSFGKKRYGGGGGGGGGGAAKTREALNVP